MLIEKGKLGVILLKNGFILEMVQTILDYIKLFRIYEDENILITTDTENNGYFVEFKKESWGIKKSKTVSNKKYSVAICNYDGYFDWDILNAYEGIRGCIYCDTELEVINVCEIIRKL